MTSPSGVIVLSCSGMTLNADNYSVNASTIGLNASSVKIPGQIVAGYVQAEGYSTGSAGSGYNKASVTLEDGEGSNPSVTPDMGSGGDGNRHCAAHEETKEALDIIADCLQKIDELLPYGGNYSAIPGLADNTIMNKNTGE